MLQFKADKLSGTFFVTFLVLNNYLHSTTTTTRHSLLKYALTCNDSPQRSLHETVLKGPGGAGGAGGGEPTTSQYLLGIEILDVQSCCLLLVIVNNYLENNV